MGAQLTGQTFVRKLRAASLEKVPFELSNIGLAFQASQEVPHKQQPTSSYSEASRATPRKHPCEKRFTPEEQCGRLARARLNPPPGHRPQWKWK